MVYVIGDIHGCYDEWMKLHNRILTDDPDARFILIGDIIDRGPKTIDMVDWMLKNVDNSHEDSRYRMVIGNHEFEKIDWWEEAKDNWLGRISLCYDRYGFHDVLLNAELDVVQVDRIVNAFKSLPYYIDIKVAGRRFIIAHGDVFSGILNKDGSLLDVGKLTYDDRFKIVWNRAYGAVDVDAEIINGHTPTFFLEQDGIFDATPGRCYHNANRHIIDCGLVYSHYPEHNLCALRLNDMQEIYLYSEDEVQDRIEAKSREFSDLLSTFDVGFGNEDDEDEDESGGFLFD